ncbi:FKBP-type peptidyl-prolyl cis-trans isomerase [soil metagenome]
MNRPVIALLIASVSLSQGACQPRAAPKPGAASIPLNNLEAQASYGLGFNVGSTFVEQAINHDLDTEAFIQGLRDGLDGADPRLTEEQLSEATLRFQQQLAARQEEMLREIGQQFQEEGRRFLAAKASEPGVQTLPSGLQYRVLQEGNGPIPGAEDSVYLRYVGSLTNGTVIEDSEDFGGTVAMAIDDMIAGWQEALQLMKVGSKWELFIPPELAYGAEAIPGRLVPPHAVLVYEMELLEIVPESED